MGKKVIIPLLLMLVFLCGCGKADKYEQALQYMNDEQYIAAISVFSELGDYENSQNLVTECNELNGKLEKYKEAQSLMEQNKFTEASDIFKTLGDYKDSSTMQKEALYQYALVLKEDKDLLKKDYSPNREELYSILKSLGNYNDSESILKETQYERAVYCINKNNLSEASKAVDSLGDYKDIYELYCGLVEKKTTNILTMDLIKVSNKDKSQKLNDLYNDIHTNLKFARENFYKAIYDYAVVQMENEQYEDASQWFYYVGKYDYLDAKEKYDEVKAVLADEIRANAERIAKEKEEQEKAAKAEKEKQAKLVQEKNKSQATDISSLTMNEIGQTYIDSNGLSVVLNSYTASESEGYIAYTIKYTITNNVPDSKILPGSFKLFFTDNTGEPQYGAFNYLFYGESDSRTYTWKVLKSQTVLTLEYNANDDNAGLDGAFFRNKPKASSMHWATP